MIDYQKIIDKYYPVGIFIYTIADKLPTKLLILHKKKHSILTKI